jgi:uridine kinase
MTRENIVLPQGFEQTGLDILHWLDNHALPEKELMVVAITGESGSGKSVTALSLKKALEQRNLQVFTLHMDRSRRAYLHAIGPGEVHLDELARHIASFREGQPTLRIPVTNYEEDWFEWKDCAIRGTQVLIVEGTYVWELEDVDLHIFMEATFQETLENRKQRGRDKVDPFIESVLLLEQAYIRPGKNKAHLVIDPHYRIQSTPNSPCQNQS